MIVMPEDMKVFLKEYTRSNHYVKLDAPVSMALDDAGMAHNKVMHELERLAYVAEWADFFRQAVELDLYANYLYEKMPLSEAAADEVIASINFADKELKHAIEFANAFKH